MHANSFFSGHSIRPKKFLGQNFLTDQNVVAKIIRACRLTAQDSVLEIGPGLGVLTKEISKSVGKLTAIETDVALWQKLKEEFQDHPHVEIVRGDFLQHDFSRIPGKVKIIGNLPYYISSAIIEKILDNRAHCSHFFCTVQWEFGQRLTAAPHSKDYSALSCFVQFYADTKMHFKIRNTSFKPSPKVTSCFLQLDMLPRARYQVENEKQMFDIIRKAFQQRRKNILNALASLYDKETLAQAIGDLGLDPDSRAENLSIKNYADLANKLFTHRNKNRPSPV